MPANVTAARENPLLRAVQFGLITLELNGFDRDLCRGVHEAQNLPLRSEHPANWSADGLADAAAFAGVPVQGLNRSAQDAVFAASMTRLSAAEIRERHERLSRAQAAIDAASALADSRGFFQDLASARAYCEKQMHIGIHPLSGRIHSDLFIRGQGTAQLRSPGGLDYEISADIWIEGMKHARTFGADLHWPVDDADSRLRIREFLLAFQRPAHWSLVPEYVECQQTVDGVEKDWREVWCHNLRDDALGAGAVISKAELFRHYRVLPLYGDPAGMEVFCARLLAHLDDHFRREGTLVDLNVPLHEGGAPAFVQDAPRA